METVKEEESERAATRQNLPTRSSPCHFLMASVVVVREEVVKGGRE